MGGKGGGKKGGGGGGSVDVDIDADSDSSTVLDIVGLDDINISADVKADTTTSNTQRLELPDPIDTRLTLSVPDTIRTDQEQRNEFAITEPIVTEMSTDLDVDIKPVVVDLCLTLGVKDPPRFCLSRPYDRRFGLSLFGREVVGLEWCGSSQFIVDDVRPGGFLAGLADRPVAGRRDGKHGGHGRYGKHHRDHRDDEHHGGDDWHDERRPPDREPGVRFVIE